MMYVERRREPSTEAKMVHLRKAPLIIPFFFLMFLLVCMTNLEAVFVAGRSLKSLKEIPVGGNVTFDCSPSGPCVPCSRAEKRDVQYRCGETGYRIRLQCLPSSSETKDAENTKAKHIRSTLETEDAGFNQQDIQISSMGIRRLQEDSSESGGSTGYATYRSCIPAVDAERISVLTFEALMLVSLVSSSSFIYFRRNRGAHMRIPTNPRF